MQKHPKKIYYQVSIIFIMLFSSWQYVSATVIPITTTRPLMLLPERLVSMQIKRDNLDESYAYMKSKADAYLTGDVHALYAGALGQLAATEALTYNMTGDVAYLARAKEMLWAHYFDSGSSTYWNYQSRNGFRTDAKWATFVYDWIYNDLSPAEKTEAIGNFKQWGQYWEAYIGYPTYNASFIKSDTDEGTSLASNMLLVAMALYNDDPYALTLFDLSDGMLSDLVVGTYMNGYMQGGVWAEGSDYGPQTMQHWLLQYLINKEARNIAYPNDYTNRALDAIVHMTLPSKNGVYMYGDVEQVATDYRSIDDDGRWNFMMVATDAIGDLTLAQAGEYWLNQSVHPTSNYYGSELFLFRHAGVAGTSPDSTGMSPYFQSGESSGMQLVTWRSGWGANDSAIYFINPKNSVDHQHKDALSFSIVRGSDILTKEMTGYAGPSTSSEAHNTILIQNADGGSSNPTLRPVGYGTTKSAAGSGYVFIEGDATQIYNMTGYYAENYVNLVRRQILFTPPYAVVADTINVSTADNCTWTGSSQLAGQSCDPRWKKIVQRFLAQPTEDNGTYSAVEGSSKIYYTPVYPAVNVEVVDESVLWAGNTESTFPASQRKWHLRVSPAADSNNNKIIQVIKTTNAIDSKTAATVIEGVGSRGTLVEDLAGNIVTMFTSDEGGADMTSLSYTIDTSASSRHFIADLVSGQKYSISVDGSFLNSDTTNDAGIIEFTNASDGVHTYSIAVSTADIIAPAAPSGLSVQ